MVFMSSARQFSTCTRQSGICDTLRAIFSLAASRESMAANEISHSNSCNKYYRIDPPKPTPHNSCS